MALVVRRTAAAGGTDAIQNSAQGIWNQLDALLIAAGWTVLADYSTGASAWVTSTVYAVNSRVTANGNIYQANIGGTSGGAAPSGQGQAIPDGTVQWRYVLTSGANAKIYTSTGESGTEKLYCRADWTTTNLNFFWYQYAESNGNVFNINLPGNSVNFTQFIYNAATNVNYCMVADKDSFLGITVDASNNRRFWGGGNLIRNYNVNSTSFASNGVVTAGTNRTFTFSSGDPIASGYQVGDLVMVIAQQNVLIGGVIPCYSATITALTSNSITIDNARETTQAGALVGADPMPYHWVTQNLNIDPSSSSLWYHANYIATTVTNIYSSQTSLIGYGGQFPEVGLRNINAEVDPNNRTNLVVLTTPMLRVNGDQLRGTAPKCFLNPRATDALWSIARTTRQATNFDYVTFPATPPASGSRSCIGPIPISGASTYTAIIAPTDDRDIWLEGEWVGGQQDRDEARGSGNGSSIGMGFDDYIAELIAPSLTDIIVDVLQNNTGSINSFGHSDRVSPTTLNTNVEPVPADSPTAAPGGGSSSGFNSGLN